MRVHEIAPLYLRWPHCTLTIGTQCDQIAAHALPFSTLPSHHPHTTTTTIVPITTARRDEFPKAQYHSDAQKRARRLVAFCPQLEPTRTRRPHRPPVDCGRGRGQICRQLLAAHVQLPRRRCQRVLEHRGVRELGVANRRTVKQMKTCVGVLSTGLVP